MDESLRTQLRYMEEEWNPPAPVPRWQRTPLADFLWHGSLIACRGELPKDLSGMSMLLVNCGSGEDAHFFETEETGRLAVTDLSKKAVTHTRNRCQVCGGIVADTCHLPFADRSFDLVGVRSGLHHLEDPWAGLAEMGRVAKAGVFFIEGHQTALTRLWVLLGILEHEEEAGNKVIRFDRETTSNRLDGMGFADKRIQTGFMFSIPALIALSGAVPGRPARNLFRGILRGFNALFGRWGNCFVAVAYRLKKSPVTHIVHPVNSK
jgi:SAM-dependent methyltransferase